MSHLDKVARSRPSPLIHFYHFSEGGVLFVEGTSRILTLNHSAALIWCLLGEVSCFAELVSALADRFSVDRNELERDAEAALELFIREDLLDEMQLPDHETIELPRVLATQGAEIAEALTWTFKKYFKLAGHVFEVAIQDIQLADGFVAAMSHLAAGKSKLPDTRIWVLPGKEPGDLWDIYLDRRLFDSGIQANSVLPVLLFLVFVRASDALASSLLFHAAVMENGGRATLFPGIAGSGKSTMAAALATRGYRFFSDELAILNKKNLKVKPFSMPISIKDGSMAALEKYYPQLFEAETYLRPDNRIVRYLLPAASNLAGADEEASIASLVFPKYNREGSARLKEIGKADALKRLAATGSSDRELALDDVEAMIAIVEQVPCHELVFSDLDKAIELLKDSVIN